MDVEGKEMTELRPLHLNGGSGTTPASPAPPASSYLHHSPQHILQQTTHCQPPPLHPHHLPHAHQHFSYPLMHTHGSDADALSMAGTVKKHRTCEDDILGQSDGKEHHACANDASTCAHTVHHLHQSNNADGRLMKPFPSYSSGHISNPTFFPNADMNAAAAMDLTMHQQQQTHGILANASLSDASTTTPPQPSSNPQMLYAAGDTPLPDPYKKKKARARKVLVDGDCSVLTAGPSSAALPTSTKTGYRYRARGKTGVLDQGLRPHIITIARGEDVSLRISSFQQEGNWEICVLSALGSISNVTLRHSETCGGTITYEGCYDILSLSGSLSPISNKEGCQNRGGLIASLAGLDGRVIGGEVTGIFVAASPIKVVVGTYISEALASQMQKQNILQARGTTARSPSCMTIPMLQTSTLEHLHSHAGDPQQYQCPSHILTSQFLDTDGPHSIVGPSTM